MKNLKDDSFLKRSVYIQFIFLPFTEEKLKNHLHLLRQEYVKLQQKLVDLKEKYDVAVAAQGEQGEDNFVARLLAFVADLFDKDLYRY